MSLDELLHLYRLYRFGLLVSRSRRVVPWSPNTRLPREIRAAIAQHNADLRMLIASADVRVCEDAGMHRPGWKYDGQGRFTCEICQRLQGVA